MMMNTICKKLFMVIKKKKKRNMRLCRFIGLDADLGLFLSVFCRYGSAVWDVLKYRRRRDDLFGDGVEGNLHGFSKCKAFTVVYVDGPRVRPNPFRCRDDDILICMSETWEAMPGSCPQQTLSRFIVRARESGAKTRPFPDSLGSLYLDPPRVRSEALVCNFPADGVPQRFDFGSGVT